MEISKEFMSFMNSSDSVGTVPATTTMDNPKGSGLTIDKSITDFISSPDDSQDSSASQGKVNHVAEADRLMNSLILTESNGVHREVDGTLRVSEKGAQGITQLMPKTTKDPGYGIQPLRGDSPEEYARFGKDYLSTMIRVFDNVEQGVAAYNAGPGAVHRAISKAGRTGRNWKEFLPKETQDYIKKVR